MAIVRWNPARDLMQMREEMDRLFSRFLQRGDGEEVSWARGIGRHRSISMRPTMPLC